ncbi:hypothetical protein C2R22_07700 [Salinigranum rubrum]|uniref:Uncharacterized protein n=1 Tax=Salinigranum rubrum TaxID=755307 RepID=A0A2I8VI17_9EURY|nr:hypothetical protein [Salinigranum rubrum]AUV81555.1 hypothetical protein C2R22_07700 [Salinigranum rubrum]
MPPHGSRDEEGVIDPEDLDITKNEQVKQLREGQYIIATDGTADDVADLREDIKAELEAESTPASDPRSALVDHLESLSTANGFVVAGRFDGDVHVTESASDDPGAVFRDLLTWYATHVDEGTPSPEVLGILCLAGEVQVRYPVRTLVDLLAAHDLSPDDSIRDLLAAVRDDGLVLPPDDDASG